MLESVNCIIALKGLLDMNRLFALPVFFWCLVDAPLGFSDELTLSLYLNQVSDSHEGIKANKMATETQSSKNAESELATSTNFFMTAQSLYDAKHSAQPGRGSKLSANGVSFGMSKLTDYGLFGKVTYNLTKTELPDASAQILPETSYFDTSTTVEVNQSLLKNANGSDIKNAKALQKSQAQLNVHVEQMKHRATLAEAEGAYWRLVLAREALKFQKENLTRTEALVKWMSRKVSSKLADSSELIQAQALFELRKLELQAGIDEERAAMHAFNTARNVDSAQVSESLARITPELIENLELPKFGVRPDVAAAEESVKVAESAAALGREKYKTSLDVFASLALNGHDQKSEKAIAEGFTAQSPTRIIGVKLNVPLDDELIRSAREGYGKDLVVAELNANRKKFEADREWSELSQKVSEVKNRLRLSEKMSAIHKKKLEAERAKQKVGRSVLFQVIQYESDLVSSQLNVIRTKGELLSLVARMKLFGVPQ
jgi:outer membrane protein TolC